MKKIKYLKTLLNKLEKEKLFLMKCPECSELELTTNPVGKWYCEKHSNAFNSGFFAMKSSRGTGTKK